jgi:hypothetical protein
MSNVPGLYGYDADSVLDKLRPRSLRDVWQGAGLDKPIPNTEASKRWFSVNPDDPGGWDATSLMRREFGRIGMGVHTPNPKTDFFQNTGSVRGSDGSTHPSVQLSERFTDPQTGMLRQDEDSLKIYRGLFNDLRPGRNSWYPGHTASDVLGNYHVDRPGDNAARGRDFFSYSLEPRNQKNLWPLTRELLRHPSHAGQPMTGVNVLDELRGGMSDNKGTYLKSLWARTLMDKVVGPNPAVFNTTLKYDPSSGLPTQQFSNITHDEGVGKDDAAMAKYLKPFNE